MAAGLTVILGAGLVSGAVRAACLFATCVSIALLVVLVPPRLRTKVAPFVAAFVAAAGVLPVFLADDDDGPGPVARPTPSARPGNEALKDVLSHVPRGLRDGCIELPRPPDDAPGSANCYPGAGAAFVQYRLYLDSGGMKQAFETDVEANLGFDPPLRDECADDGTGLETWEYGRVLCYILKGEASVVWTDNRLNIFAWAKRGDDDFKALLDTWREGSFGLNP